jgi:hypothetical protein
MSESNHPYHSHGDYDELSIDKLKISNEPNFIF